MSKKTATIIIMLLILFIVGGLLFFYFYYLKQQPEPEIPDDDDVESVFPTGKGQGKAGDPDATDPDEQTGPVSGTAVPRLRQISTVPTAGAVVYKEGGATKIRYMESGTGHTKETAIDTTEIKRVTNTTIPRVHEAFWHGKGGALVARHLKDDGETIESIYGSIFQPENGQTGELTAKFLTNNIKEVTLSPAADRIFYLLETSTGSVGTISDLDGSKKVQLFASPLKEWLLSWPKSDTAAVTTKPSGSALGYLYLLNTRTERMTLVVGDIFGLTALVSPDANEILYSETQSSEVKMHLYNVSANTRKSLPFSTFPEKCVWSKKEKELVYCAIPGSMPEALYPDAWYKGRVGFSDDIWRINTKTDSYDLLIKLKDSARKDIDSIKLFMDEEETHLFFTDKDSLTLWSLRLEK